MSEPELSPCRVCGTATTPCTGKRGCRHKGRWEWYMLTARIWAAVGGGEGYLCIGCVEALLGRPLHRGDFLIATVNEPGHPWNTARLEAALARPAPRRPVRLVRQRWPRPGDRPQTLGDRCPARDDAGVRCTAAASDHPDQHVNSGHSWPISSLEAAQIRYATNMAAGGLEVTIIEHRPGMVQISGRRPGTEQ